MTLINEHPGFDQLSAFVDGELSSGEQRQLEQHLAACHSCALQTVSASRLKTAVARVSEDFAAPPEVLERLAAQLRVPIAKSGSPVGSARFFVWGAMAASLLLVLSSFTWWQSRKSAGLDAELLDQHLAALSIGAAPEVISSDRHTVKPWFQGKLPFSFNLPDPLPAGDTLKGADLTFVEGHPAALLLFTVGKHQASIFVTQNLPGSTSSLFEARRSGFVIRRASTHDLEITAVSDVNASELALLLSAVAEAQSPR